MKRFFILGAALGAITLAAAAPPAMAAVSVGFSIHAGDPFHGFSLRLSSAPNVAYIPGTRVGYVQNYDGDLYSYGNQWYLDQDDQWYCASSYNGPFYEIGVSSLPFDVSRFPAGYRGVVYQQPTVAYDRGYVDRDRSYPSNNQAWNQRDARGWNGHDNRTANNQGRNRDQGWNHKQDGNRYRGGNHNQNGRRNDGGRFGGRDRDGGRG